MLVMLFISQALVRASDNGATTNNDDVCDDGLCDGGAAVCGNGDLQTTSTGDATCIDLLQSGTLLAAGTVTEQCDMDDHAIHGIGTDSCALTCQPNHNTDGPLKFRQSVDGAALAKQLMSLAPIEGWDNRVSMCMYSSQLVTSEGVSTSNYETAAGCYLSHTDFVNNPSLQCYYSNTDDYEDHMQNGLNLILKTGNGNGLSASELKQVGQLRQQDGWSYQHKCVDPLVTSVSPTTTALQSRALQTQTTDVGIATATAPFPRMHDFCFDFKETNYGQVNEAGFMFAKTTKIDYTIICDPMDQKQLIGTQSRFGQMGNPCEHNANRPWRLMLCEGSGDSETCTHLGHDSQAYTNQYNANSDEGTKFEFSHDMNHNPFECEAHTFSNGAGAQVTELPNVLHTCARPQEDHQVPGSTSEQTYSVSCGKTLKLEMDQGWGGIFFRVEFTATSSSSAPKANGAMYTSKSTEMLGFFIKAQVSTDFLASYIPANVALDYVSGKNAEPALDNTVDGGVNGEVILFDGHDNQNPFYNWELYNTGAWQAAEIPKFSPTAKLNVEYIDCTETTGYVLADSNGPRFAMVGLNPSWYENTDIDNLNSRAFVYDNRTQHYEAPYAQDADTHEHISHWKNEAKQMLAIRGWNTRLNANDIYAQPWHGYHTGKPAIDDNQEPGLCVQMKYTLYEPSSCDAYNFTTAGLTIPVASKQIEQSTAGMLTVESKQSKKLWKETESIPLDISIEYDQLQSDSAMFYISHITIEDMGEQAEHVNADTAGGWDLISHNLDNQPAAQGSSKSNQPARIKKHGHVWTSYANAATKFLDENRHVTFGSDELETHLQDHVTPRTGAECYDTNSCLEHARKDGTQLFANLELRPAVNSAMRSMLKITVFAKDGATTHAFDQAVKHELFGHTPISVPIDQGEGDVALETKLNENEKTTLQMTSPFVIPFNKRHLDGNEHTTHVCVYYDKTTEHQIASVTNDNNRNVAIGTLCQPGNFNYIHECPVHDDYDLHCLPAINNKHSEHRLSISSLVLFDQSEISNMPGGAIYQPAGYNNRAVDKQWYRLESCNNDTLVKWCDSSSSHVSQQTTGLALNASLISDDSTDVCKLPVAGFAHYRGDDGQRHFMYTTAFTPTMQQMSSNPIDSDLVSIKETQNNFWHIDLEGNEFKHLSQTEFCIQGLSGFNTKITGTEFPVKLTVRYAVTETFTFEQEGFRAVHVYNVQTTKVQIKAVTQIATTEILTGEDDNYSVVERSSVSSTNTPKWGTAHLPSDSSSDNCKDGKSGTQFCLDRLQLNEVSYFQDQYMGRIQIQCEVTKSKSDLDATWYPAGGLFDVFRGQDSISEVSGITQVEGFLNGVHDVYKQFSEDDSSHSYLSQCALSTPPSTSDETACTFATDPHTYDTGGNSETRTQYYTEQQAVSNVLAPRKWRVNLDLAFPYDWHGVRFRCNVTAGNAHREHYPVGCLAHNNVFLDRSCNNGSASDTQSVTVSIKPTSSDPYMFFESDPFEVNAHCTGNDVYTGTCNGTTTSGVAGKNMEQYEDTTTKKLNNRWGVHPGPDVILDVFARELKKIRVVFGSYNTDSQEDFNNPVIGASNYVDPSKAPFRQIQSTLAATGKVVHLTIESKRGDLQLPRDTDVEQLHFCLWACPFDKPACEKFELQRVQNMDDDFDPKTDNMYADPDPDLSPPHQFDCPEYNTNSTSGKNPGTKYSIKCPTTGRCHMYEDLYISYPQQETRDDLLEVAVWDRNDYRGADFWKSNSLSAYVKLKPAIIEQQVSFDCGWFSQHPHSLTFDTTNGFTRTKQAGSDAKFPYRMVISERDFAQYGVELDTCFAKDDLVVATDTTVWATIMKTDPIELCDRPETLSYTAEWDSCNYMYQTGMQLQTISNPSTDLAMNSTFVTWAKGSSSVDKSIQIQSSSALDDKQCGPAKQVQFVLATNTSGSATKTRGVVQLTILDDDFYGQFMLWVNGSTLDPDLLLAARNPEISKQFSHWSSGETEQFEVHRFSTSSDVGLKLQAAKVTLSVEVNQYLMQSDWKIVVKTYSAGSFMTTDTYDGTDFSAYELSKYRIDLIFDEIESDANNAGALLSHKVVSFEYVGAQTACGVVGSPKATFSLTDVKAEDGTSQTTSNCPRSEDTLSTHESSIAYTFNTATSESTRTDRPWQVSFGSLLEASDTSSMPVHFNHKMPNLVKIEEAESMLCHTPEGIGCSGRTVSWPVCLQPRSGTEGTTQDSNAQNSGSLTFVIGLHESVSTRQPIGNNYNFKCPVSLPQYAGADIECKQISQLLYNDNSTLTCTEDLQSFKTANPLYSSLDADDFESYCTQQPQWLQVAITTTSGYQDSLSCNKTATELPTVDFRVIDNDEEHMSYDVHIFMENRVDDNGDPTCTSFGGSDKVELKILQYTPLIFDNTYKLREEQFTRWEDDVMNNAATGLMSFSVVDKYYLDTVDDERTIVNHGLGECPTPGQTWDNQNLNPLNTTHAMFGSCDSFDMATLKQMLLEKSVPIDNREAVFEAIFSSKAMSQDEYNDPSNPLAAYMTYNLRDIPHLNFTATRAISPDQVNSGGAGVRLETSTTLAKIQSCRTYNDMDVLHVTETNGQTIYKFHAFVSKITAQYKNDMQNPTYSMRCDQQEYTFSANNQLTAVVAASAAGGSVTTNDQVYVQSMAAVTCDGTNYDAQCFGNTCKQNGKVDDLMSLKYVVHLDTKVINQVMQSGFTQKSYVAASETLQSSDITMNENCYATTVQSVKVTHPQISGSVDDSIVRTSITFQTGCLDTTDQYGNSVTDTFSKCTNNPEMALSFSFAASLYKCTNAASLISTTTASSSPKDPQMSTECGRMKSRQFTVSMQYQYTPAIITKQVASTLYSTLQVGYPRPPTSLITNPVQLKNWIDHRTLDNSAAMVTEGEAINVVVCTTGAEDISTLQIKRVDMAVPKLMCHLSPYSPAYFASTVVPCTNANLNTHSPFVAHAGGLIIKLGGNTRACATLPVSDVANCQLGQHSNKLSNPAPAYGDYDANIWEEFLYYELECIFGDTTQCSTLPGPAINSIAALMGRSAMVNALSPFAYSPEHLITTGKVTTLARQRYGDAMANRLSNNIYPKEQHGVGKGVGTCTNGLIGTCKWQNMPRNPVTGGLSSTCDVFYMQIPLKRGQSYGLSIMAEQIANNGASTARRLLSTVLNPSIESIHGITTSGFSIIPALDSDAVETASHDNSDHKWKRTNPDFKEWLYPSKDNMQARDPVSDKYFLNKDNHKAREYWAWTALALVISMFVMKSMIFTIFATSKYMHSLDDQNIFEEVMFWRPNTELLLEIFSTKSKYETKDIHTTKHNELKDSKQPDSKLYNRMSPDFCSYFKSGCLLAIPLYLEVCFGAHGVILLIHLCKCEMQGDSCSSKYRARTKRKCAMNLSEIVVVVFAGVLLPIYVNSVCWFFVFVYLAWHRKYKNPSEQVESLRISSDTKVLSNNPKFRYAVLAQAAGGAPVENSRGLDHVFGSKAYAHPSNKESRDFSIP